MFHIAFGLKAEHSFHPGEKGAYAVIVAILKMDDQLVGGATLYHEKHMQSHTLTTCLDADHRPSSCSQFFNPIAPKVNLCIGLFLMHDSV